MPISVPGSSKFGGRDCVNEGMFSNTMLPASVKASLASMCSFSKANGTWSTYRTAERMLLMCQKEHKKKFDWPISKDNVYLFIHWLIVTRGLRVTTINSYLAGVRQLHIARGLEPPLIRDSFVKEILKGRENMEATAGSGRPAVGRLPMTIALMKLWKEKIRLSDMNIDIKLVIWSVSTLAFYGAFRIHELVSRTEATFDPYHTLLTEDVQLRGKEGERWLEISLKCPKEKKAGRPTVIDVFEIGGPLCPVNAFLKWAGPRPPRPGMPIFCGRDGTSLTGRKINEYLKLHLGKFARYKGGTISSHSFRSGIVTILGSKGFSDEEIKLVGRWSSRAFIKYMKLPRTQRAAIARKIGNL